MEIIKLVVVGLLAVCAGASIGRQGVLTGWTGNLVVNVRLFKRTLAIRTYQFRHDKSYFQAVLTSPIGA